MLVTLLAMVGGSRATYLAVNGEAYKEPNDDANYGMFGGKHEQKTWCNQCMRNGNESGMPMVESRESNCEENEKEVTVGYGNNSYEKDVKSWHYEIKNVEVNGAYMNVKGNVVEYDEGLEIKNDLVGGMDLAAMNKFYEYINELVYVVNFVYVNFYEYLTAELYYMMVTLVSALWIWKRKQRSTRKKVKESHLSCSKVKLRTQGLDEPCGMMRGNVVLHVPVARHEKRRQRLHELCQQRKMKVVLWLAMMYSAQAMEGSPMAGGSQGERVFLERVTSLTEAATAAANAATQALSSMSTRASTGLESATRILKAPDVFTGEDPMVFQTWKFQFSSWLSFGDQRFQDVLEKG